MRAHKLLSKMKPLKQIKNIMLGLPKFYRTPAAEFKIPIMNFITKFNCYLELEIARSDFPD